MLCHLLLLFHKMLDPVYLLSTCRDGVMNDFQCRCRHLVVPLLLNAVRPYTHFSSMGQSLSEKEMNVC